MPKQKAPYGTWTSPITVQMLTENVVGLGQLEVSGDNVYWLEGRPQEDGRQVVVCRSGDGYISDVTPPGFNVRTRVHEYGGGAYGVHGSTVWFSNFDDQRLYRQEPGAAPAAITGEPDRPAADRFADLAFTADGSHIYCIREHHPARGEARNELVRMPADGSGPVEVVASGHDFYSSPRLSPDGSRLAWLSWDHPRMPWDGTELWAAHLATDGAISEPVLVAGDPVESIFQPEFGPDGALHFVSDRTGWWNLYKVHEGAEPEPMAEMEAEFGLPQWQLGMKRYTVLSDGAIVAAFSRDGHDALAEIRGGTLTEIGTGHNVIKSQVVSTPGRVWMIAGNPATPTGIIGIDLLTGRIQTVRSSRTTDLDAGYLAVAKAIEFPTGGGLTAHALFYPPRNRDFRAPATELPPLLVRSHGGPTSYADAEFTLDHQFWTSRGFAIVDVNYGGSSGYGRAYRERLKGQWGIVDTVDCINAARYLAEQNRVDGTRLAIRGRSAGGYTTLNALAFHDTFAAGASHFGVGDLVALADHTHKFESRYLDGLVGPYPEAADLYRQRSPLFHAANISCPVILFQGLDDEVVPPQQAEDMVAALEANGLAHAYVAFEGEQHGFRKSQNIERANEAELFFYSKIFGFDLADDVEPIEIKNLA